MKRRVVITGIGPATAVGIGKEQFISSIWNMKTHLVKVPGYYEKNYTFKSRYYVPKPEFSLADLEIPKSADRMMEEAARLAVLCTRLALDEAGFEISKGQRYFQVSGLDNCPVIIGVGMSSLQTAFESYLAHLADKNRPDHPGGENVPRYNRMVIPLLMPNSAAAWISILFGLQGLNYTVNAACASGTVAIGEAYRSILQGRCKAVITGGVEALAERHGAVMRGFDMLTTLTESADGLPRPFSKKRSGFLFNEGAGCVLLLEELQSALKRGAVIYAEIVGYEASAEAYNIVQMDPSGQNLLMLYKKITKGIKIDYLNTHGTGTVSNDEIEAKVIKTVFGKKESQPYLNSTKGLIGHSIGASGALETAVTAMSLKHSIIHGNHTCDTIENLNLPLSTIETKMNYALSASYGFGGHNALILLKRFDKNE